MSGENVELVRRGYERLQGEGYESLFEILHPDFEVTTTPEMAIEPDTYRGHEGVRRYFESFFEVMDEVSFIAERFIDAGEAVIVPTILRIRGRATGIEVEQKVVLAWSVRDGKVTGTRPFATLAEAKAAFDPE